jgi:hypothetical protein
MTAILIDPECPFMAQVARSSNGKFAAPNLPFGIVATARTASLMRFKI